MQRWCVGLTTVPERRTTSLPKTLDSLQAAGFPLPWLFVDGAQSGVCWHGLSAEGITCRWPQIKPYPNWLLGLYELLMRNPTCSRFLMTQDDVLFSRNARDYLDRRGYPDGGSDKYPRERGYWNLYSVPAEELLLAGKGEGWHASSQQFKGALALAFDRDCVVELLAAQHGILRVLDANRRAWCNIDGMVGECLSRRGERREMAHVPSLVQHMEGIESTIPKLSGPAGVSETFRGEGFDCLSLLPGAVHS